MCRRKKVTGGGFFFEPNRKEASLGGGELGWIAHYLVFWFAATYAKQTPNNSQNSGQKKNQVVTQNKQNKQNFPTAALCE